MSREDEINGHAWHTADLKQRNKPPNGVRPFREQIVPVRRSFEIREGKHKDELWRERK